MAHEVLIDDIADRQRRRIGGGRRRGTIRIAERADANFTAKQIGQGFSRPLGAGEWFPACGGDLVETDLEAKTDAANEAAAFDLGTD